jgi:hypothetical protein
MSDRDSPNNRLLCKGCQEVGIGQVLPAGSEESGDDGTHHGRRNVMMAAMQVVTLQNDGAGMAVQNTVLYSCVS